MSKLFLKGNKEPIEINESEANSIQTVLLDGYASADTPISLEKIWTGRKGDVKYVLFEKEREYSSDIAEMNPAEARMFKEELEPFRQEAEKINTGWSYVAPVLWMQKQGAINFHVIDLPHQGAKTWRIGVIDPVKYRQLSQKIESYDKWVFKTEYAEKKKNEHLEKLAEQQ